jgi:hypothetical protein
VGVRCQSTPRKYSRRSSQCHCCQHNDFLSYCFALLSTIWYCLSLLQLFDRAYFSYESHGDLVVTSHVNIPSKCGDIVTGWTASDHLFCGLLYAEVWCVFRILVVWYIFEKTAQEAHHVNVERPARSNNLESHFLQKPKATPA